MQAPVALQSSYANGDNNLACLAGHELYLDKDKAKYESLKARMQNEQHDFLKKLRSKALSDPTRYTGCHDDAVHQIEVLFWPV